MTDEVKNIKFMAAHIENDILYGAGIDRNILFQYDIKKKKLQRLGVFSKFKNPYSYKIGKIFKYKEKLFCFSINSYEVAEYHIEKKAFTYYCIEKDLKKDVSIKCICRVGNDVWMFQEVTAQFVVVFSMETKQYSKYIFDISVLIGYDFSFSICQETSLYYDEKIWRCIPGHHMLVSYDVKTLQTEIIDLETTVSFYTISHVDGKIFILGRDGKQIVKWKPDTKELCVWDTGYKGIEDRPFREVICYGNRLFLLPCFENKIYCYDIQGEELHFLNRIDNPTKFKKLNYVGGQSMFINYAWGKEKELYLFPFGGNGMLCLNTESLVMSFYPVQISEEDYIISNFVLNDLLFDREAKVGCLVEFIKLMTEQNDYRRQRKMVGNKCWERLYKV